MHLGQGIEQAEALDHAVVARGDHVHTGRIELARRASPSSRGTSNSAVSTNAGGRPVSCSVVARSGEALLAIKQRSPASSRSEVDCTARDAKHLTTMIGREDRARMAQRRTARTSAHLSIFANDGLKRPPQCLSVDRRMMASCPSLWVGFEVGFNAVQNIAKRHQDRLPRRPGAFATPPEATECMAEHREVQRRIRQHERNILELPHKRAESMGKFGVGKCRIPAFQQGIDRVAHKGGWCMRQWIALGVKVKSAISTDQRQADELACSVVLPFGVEKEAHTLPLS